MIRRLLGFAVLLAGVFTLIAFLPEGKSTREQLILREVMRSLDKDHFEQVKIDDKFSERVFEMYLDRLDPNKRFFLAADLEKLDPYRRGLDEEIEKAQFKFLDLSSNLFDKRRKESEKLVSEILEEPFDFTLNEEIELDGDKINYASSKADQRDAWRKQTKYQVLLKLYELTEQQAQNDSTPHKSMAELEVQARGDVKKTMTDYFRRLEQLRPEDRFSLYINSITSAYDPHSNFYPPQDKENFDISFTGRLEGIGATLQEKDGYIKVIRIVPGSASWKQGELKSGDLILKVGQDKEEPVDIVGMRLDDAVQLIRGPKGSQVRLTVKKIDGSIKIISIVRDVVILEETYARSAVIEGQGVRLGYIDLPQFYADFSNSGGPNCATDVKRELEKLQGEGIDGLVLDLRDNGGGSLTDVVRMAGFFIERGPVVQIKARTGTPYIMEDKDPSVIYTGPFIILVNEFSASASEILAAAMQDYGRAIVLGGRVTHGKGTVQRILELDKTAEVSNVESLGALKLTTQKFYRIDGRSTQLHGVESDVIVPDMYSYLEVGEQELDYPLPWDEISPARYEPWLSGREGRDSLLLLSQTRVDTGSVFRRIEGNARRLETQSKQTNMPLNFEAFRTLMKEREAQSAQFENLLEEISLMNVRLTEPDAKLTVVDKTKHASFMEWMSDLKEDPYLFESLRILSDLESVRLAHK